MLGVRLKALILGGLFGHWRRAGSFLPGYTILLPVPMDMPFLLRFALEGLSRVDTSSCRQIIVLPDGAGADGGEGLRRVLATMADPRVELAPLRPLSRLVVHGMGRPGHSVANWAHWAMIVEGINRTRCEHVFLHDADAFFVGDEDLERQYRACRDEGMLTLGVTARSDAFFEQEGQRIPGTWELMFSTNWARGYRPFDLKGQWHRTPRGPFEFDTMLYPQYRDYPTGKVGVLDPPPRVLHFAGAITTYRAYRDRVGRRVVDEFFRLLLLAMLETLLPESDGSRALPTVGELTRGLSDPHAPIGYDSDGAVREYPIFRAMIETLGESKVFGGSRAGQLREFLRPFDAAFLDRIASTPRAPPAGGVPRRHGLA